MIFDGESVNMMPFTPLDFEVSYFQTKSTQKRWNVADLSKCRDGTIFGLAKSCASEHFGPVFAGENHHFTQISVVSFKRSMHKQSTWFCGATLFLNATCNSTQLFLLNGNKIMYFSVTTASCLNCVKQSWFFNIKSPLSNCVQKSLTGYMFLLFLPNDADDA